VLGGEHRSVPVELVDQRRRPGCAGEGSLRELVIADAWTHEFGGFGAEAIIGDDQLT